MSPSAIVGLHHVTGIASDPQRNLDFYTGVLGLRFVKRTVNFDDPGTYHFYFGDDAGSPGTILTFFCWPRVGQGLSGSGSVTHTAFLVPLKSLSYWQQRLADKGVVVQPTGKRFDEEVLTFADPNGLKIEIVGRANVMEAKAPRFSDVPPAHAIRGFFGVTLLERNSDETAKMLNIMGFKKIAEEGGRLRFSAGGAAFGNLVDVVIDPNASYGNSGTGTVHHIAFRAADEVSQLEWRREIGKYLEVSDVIDRDYFHSFYFPEPGGVLFELATDLPGFASDEPIESLGDSLRIPKWLEPTRSLIEQQLPPIVPRKPNTRS